MSEPLHVEMLESTDQDYSDLSLHVYICLPLSVEEATK